MSECGHDPETEKIVPEEGVDQVDAEPNGGLYQEPGVIFNHNLYAQKKVVASGLLDLALLSANASQLKICVQNGPERQEFYYILLVLIASSICLQVTTAILFVIILRRHDKHQQFDKCHSRHHRAPYPQYPYPPYPREPHPPPYPNEAYLHEERTQDDQYNDRYQRSGADVVDGNNRDQQNGQKEALDWPDEAVDMPHIEKTSKINDAATVFVIMITVINVFISGFGMSLHTSLRDESM